MPGIKPLLHEVLDRVPLPSTWEEVPVSSAPPLGGLEIPSNYLTKRCTYELRLPSYAVLLLSLCEKNLHFPLVKFPSSKGQSCSKGELKSTRFSLRAETFSSFSFSCREECKKAFSFDFCIFLAMVLCKLHLLRWCLLLPPLSTTRL